MNEIKHPLDSRTLKWLIIFNVLGNSITTLLLFQPILSPIVYGVITLALTNIYTAVGVYWRFKTGQPISFDVER